MNIFFQPYGLYQNYNNTNFTARKKTVNKLVETVPLVTKELSDYQKKLAERNEKILKLLTEGKNRKEIAEILYTTITIVNKVAQENKTTQKKLVERAQRVVEKLKSGLTINQIAKEEGVHPTTIFRISVAENIETEASKKMKERKKELIKDLNAGISVDILSKKYNLHKEYIRRIKASLGLTRVYHFLPKPQQFGYYEIKEFSQKITELRKNCRKFKEGDRTPQIIDEMEKVIKELDAKIQEFKSRL